MTDDGRVLEQLVDRYRQELAAATAGEEFLAGRAAVADTAAAGTVPDLEEALAHALVTVPFYEPYRARVQAGEPLTLRDLPLLGRRDLRERFAELISRRPGSGEVLGGHGLNIAVTSGSTGEPLSVLKTSQEDGFWDNVVRERVMSVLDLPESQLVLDLSPRSGNRPDLVGLSLYPRPSVTVSLRNWDPANDLVRHEYETVLAVLRPDLVTGSPHSLLGACEVLAGSDHSVRPGGVISSFEHLSDAARQVIEARFGCRVVNLYGTTEVGQVGWSCTEGRIHLNAGLGPVELLPDPQGAGSGNYRLIMSTAAARAMPILRYDAGDLVSGVTSDCGCGQNSPALLGLLGRAHHRLRGRSGRLYSQYEVEFQMMRFGIVAYQLVQHVPGEVELTLAPGARAEAADTAAALQQALTAVHDLPGDLRIRPGPAGWRFTSRGKRNAVVVTC